MVYWLVSLQLPGKRKDALWELLQEKTSAAALGSNYKLDIPELRVGTLDSLMALSDELSKTSNMMEAVVNKVKRQVNDAGGAKSLGSLQVEGLSTEAYVHRFKWDEAKFPARRPLKETVEKMHELVSRVEDDLKVTPKMRVQRCPLQRNRVPDCHPAFLAFLLSGQGERVQHS